MNNAQRPVNGASVIESEIDLGELLAILYQGKWRIGLSLVVAGLLGVFVALYSRPIYEADVLLQVQDTASVTPFDELSAFMGEETASQTEIEVIRSRTVVGRVVDRLNLQITATPKRGLLDRTPISRLPELVIQRFEAPQSFSAKPFLIKGLGGDEFQLEWSGQLLGQGLVGEALQLPANQIGLFVESMVRAPAGTEFEVRTKTRAVAVKQLQQSLNVTEKGKKTGIIRVALQGEDNRRIQQIVNALANVYVQQNVEQRSAEAEKSLAFLDKQLPTLRREVDAAEVALNNYLSQNKLVDLTAESQSVLGQLVAVEQRLSELNLKRAELEQQFNAQHPSLIAVAEQERQLKKQQEKLEKQIGDLPDTQQEALRLKRDVEVNNVLYTFLLNKAQELRVVKAGTVGTVRILDEAYLPYRPIKPKKSLIVVLSLMFGAMVGIVWVFLQSILSRGVRTPDEIEQKTGLSVYASIPESEAEHKLFRNHSRKQGSRALLAAANPQDLAVESLRGLRTSLHFAMMGANNNRVMISGPSPGIGKSFVSANLGYLLAETGKRVVLVDADMRKGHCHEYFSTGRNEGLSEFISGKVDSLLPLIQPHKQNRDFHILTTGQIPPNPSELLLNPRFLLALEALGEEFDVVILDTPPIMAVADAGVVLPHVGAGFVVARAGVNPVSEIEAAVKRLTQDGGKISGVILNGMTRSAGGKYGNYKYYQYDYK